MDTATERPADAGESRSNGCACFPPLDRAAGRKAIAAALVKFGAACPNIKRETTGQVGPRTYRYADLAAVRAVVAPQLAAAGLAVVQTIEVCTCGAARGAMYLRTSLLHGESGEAVESRWPIRPERDGPQALGSATTYARRYAELAILGLAPEGEDDDGAAAGGNGHGRDERGPSREDRRGPQDGRDAQRRPPPRSDDRGPRDRAVVPVGPPRPNGATAPKSGAAGDVAPASAPADELSRECDAIAHAGLDAWRATAGRSPAERSAAVVAWAEGHKGRVEALPEDLRRAFRAVLLGLVGARSVRTFRDHGLTSFAEASRGLIDAAAKGVGRGWHEAHGADMPPTEWAAGWLYRQIAQDLGALGDGPGAQRKSGGGRAPSLKDGTPL